MTKYSNEILIPLVIAAILTAIGFNIRRNRIDTFYLEFSQCNLPVSIFISLIFLLIKQPNKVKYILILFLGYMLFLIVNALTAYYKIECDTLVIRKNILTHKSYINIKEIAGIAPDINLLAESLCYKIIMADNNFYLIERYIEDAGLFFSKMKEINNEIMLADLEFKKPGFHILSSITRIILPMLFYTNGFRFLIRNILNQ